MMIYTIESLAELLGVTVHRIYKMTSKKEIAYFTVGKSQNIRFTQEQVDDYIASTTRLSIRDIKREAVARCLKRQKNA